MPRRRSRRRSWGAEHPELDVERARGGRRQETVGGRSWVVQSISAAAATKSYRCPGCQQEIPPGTAHVVAWESDAVLGEQFAVDARRHWHSGCWRSWGGRPQGPARGSR